MQLFIFVFEDFIENINGYDYNNTPEKSQKNNTTGCQPGNVIDLAQTG